MPTKPTYPRHVPTQPTPFAPPQADLDSSDQAGYPDASAEKLKETLPLVPALGGGSLSSITKTLYDLETCIVDSNGELSPELESLLSAATIAKDKKVDGYGVILDRCASGALEYATRAQRLMAVAKTFERIEEWLRSNLKYAMKLLDVKELQGQDVRFSMIVGKKVQITDPSLIPEAYLREVIKYEPNLTAIAQALKAGIEVPGATLTDSYTLRTGAPKKGSPK